MIALKRVTTEYIRSEDRIRLTAETDSGGIIRLWLARPLLNLFLPRAIKWVEQRAPLPASSQTDPSARKLMQEFAQDRAVAAMRGQPAVKGAPAQEWLVETVDFSVLTEAVRLTFKPNASATSIEPASLTLFGEAMRQWLQALHMHYRAAEWAPAIWPSWIVDASSPQPDSPVTKAH